MNLNYRQAQASDLPVLVAMLADDPLGVTREDPSLPLNPKYTKAFEAITKDPNNALVVVESQRVLVGSLQLTFIPYLNRLGSWRCLIEGVRIHKDFRKQGLGKKMILWAISEAQNKGCSLVQLTSDKQRPEALHFYESLGFVGSHEGFKLKLP